MHISSIVSHNIQMTCFHQFISLIPARYPPSLNSVIAWILMVFISLSLWFTSHHYPPQHPQKMVKNNYIRISAILSTSKMLMITDHLSQRCWFSSPCQQSPLPLASWRTTVCEMLVSGGVGRIDEIVREEAALMRRRQMRDRLGALVTGCLVCGRSGRLVTFFYPWRIHGAAIYGNNVTFIINIPQSC